MDRKVKGYTIFELLVVVVIISILAGAFLMGLRNMVLRERLYSAMTQVANDIKEVQFRSISSNATWGIRLCRGSEQYKIFTVQSGCQDATPNCTNDSSTQRLVSLPSGVVPDNDFCVVFDRRGYPLNCGCGLGMGSVTLKNAYGSRIVILNRLGRVRYE
ncbi:prepilin-type N-terminal cleavage/methylation domain-containing protein [Thermocrinis sp.]|uniref:prepilin-type N-terminal cleavage/methylation domain-containing protein n=1 Tax=Thermocrinis sp. TaxID=2024383 RepID=UPI002FDCCD3F